MNDKTFDREELDFEMLLADPMVRLLMEADGIGERDILELTKHACINRDARRSADKGASNSRDFEGLALRPGIGVMLVNARGLVFVGRRNDVAHEAWQMPQGGVETGETTLEAALRELREETRISQVALLAQSRRPLHYELPDELLRRLPALPWRGQLQTWFLMRYLGDETEIDVRTEQPEFSAWTWASPDTVTRMIVPFKRALYARVFGEFAPFLTNPP